ncbi:hypothetical protein GE21DRAFT_1202605 [Neurospora crassa]|nr:hypothetical protein B13N20.130 [imported] - Neurospora crassa [Neurospora crassa]KHE87148.1 hypothetical protein GE21DRAFT_1202605 [Neurospora crassa]
MLLRVANIVERWCPLCCCRCRRCCNDNINHTLLILYLPNTIYHIQTTTTSPPLTQLNFSYYYPLWFGNFRYSILFTLARSSFFNVDVRYAIKVKSMHEKRDTQLTVPGLALQHCRQHSSFVLLHLRRARPRQSEKRVPPRIFYRG